MGEEAALNKTGQNPFFKNYLDKSSKFVYIDNENHFRKSALIAFGLLIRKFRVRKIRQGAENGRMKRKFKDKIEKMGNMEIKRQEQYTKKIKLPEIKVLDFLYAKGGEVSYEYPELTALCPMTGIPDFYTVRIAYLPAKLIPELKSLRFYFLAFRDIPVLHEHLANKIFEDFWKSVKPKKLKVELDVAVRGGIKTKIVRERSR